MTRFAVVLPLGLALVLAGRSVQRDSCTVDEFGNLPLAVTYWGSGALHIDPGNPPLTRWIQGLGLLPLRPDPGGSPAELATIDTSWDLGYRFEAAHQDDYHELLVRARLGSLLLLLLTVAGVYGWARSLAGPVPALAASLLTAASPNLLAHGRLVTPDIGLACFVVWAGWAAHEASRTGELGKTAITGLLTGAACLSKFSGLLLVPAFIVVLSRSPGSARRRTGQIALFGGAALLVLYAAYGFPPPGALGSVPSLFPAPYAHGIDAQLKEAPYPGYLLGDVREGGWSGYYVVAFLVKTPWPAIALFGLATWLAIRDRRTEFALPIVLAALFFFALSLGTKKNVGLRYVLPVFPLLHVIAAAAFGRLSSPAGAAFAQLSSPAGRVAGVLLALAVVAGVRASAAPLSYFNGTERLLGGKRAVLVDSNLDWGQALPDLREWMQRENIETVRLAYFGRIDPSRYDVHWRSLPSEPVEGPVAISATLAVGRPYVVRWKERPFVEPTLGWSRADTWEWVRDLEPDEVLGGGSILVWKDAAAARPQEEPGDE